MEFKGNKDFREHVKKKYSSDKRYNTMPGDVKQRYSLRNKFGFYFEYRKFAEAVKLFNYEKLDFTNMKILDIGCHRGFQLNQLAFLKGTSKEIYGIDFMPDFIKQAKSINPSINFKAMDVYDLKFKDDYFDFIGLIYFLNCIPPKDRGEIAKKISKKINKGGYILVFELSDNPIINIIRKIIKFVKGADTRYIEFASDRILHKYFKDFKIVKSKNMINFLSAPLCEFCSYPFIELLDSIVPNNYYIALLRKEK